MLYFWLIIECCYGGYNIYIFVMLFVFVDLEFFIYYYGNRREFYRDVGFCEYFIFGYCVLNWGIV